MLKDKNTSRQSFKATETEGLSLFPLHPTERPNFLNKFISFFTCSNTGCEEKKKEHHHVSKLGNGG